MILALIVVIALIVILSYVYITKRFPKETFELNLPEKEKIVSIKLEEGISVKIVSDSTKINDIYDTIASANYKTNNKSKTEMPKGYNTLIKLSFNYEDEVATTIYVYTKNSKYYLEQSTNGIYDIDSNVFEAIENYLI